MFEHISSNPSYYVDLQRETPAAGLEGVSGWEHVFFPGDKHSPSSDSERAFLAASPFWRIDPSYVPPAPAPSDLEAQVAALTAERDTLQAQVTALTSERDALQAQVAALTAERDALQAQVAALTANQPLPADFPQRPKLMAAGFESIALVRAATDAQLGALDGVGAATLTQIRQAAG
jgi:cell division protein FtsB